MRRPGVGCADGPGTDGDCSDGVTTTAVPAPAVLAPVARSVRVQISDAPPQLTATVDGRPASLPLVLPAGPTAHSVVFHAPGYGDRNIVVDGSVDRTLTLGMARLPAAESPAPETERPAAGPAVARGDVGRLGDVAPAPPSRAHDGSAARARRRRAEAVAVPVPSPHPRGEG